MNESDLQTKQDKPKKKVWLWWFGGCGLLVCIAIGSVVFWLLSPSEPPSYPLDGDVSFPSSVRAGDDFDFVVTVTNPTTEPIFIRHVVLHNFLAAPSLLDGAIMIGVDPAMEAEPFGAQEDVQFVYFQELRPAETQNFIFHMRAQTIGTYYENVGVYAKHPVYADPAFIDAYHYATARIEITP